MALWRNANSGATAPKREGVFFTMRGYFVVVRHGEQLHFPQNRFMQTCKYVTAISIKL